MEWARQIQGVGGARVFPLWAGPKTVKVVIVNAEHRPASTLLVSGFSSILTLRRGWARDRLPWEP